MKHKREKPDIAFKSWKEEAKYWKANYLDRDREVKHLKEKLRRIAIEISKD